MRCAYPLDHLVRLYHTEGLTLHEVGARVGISHNAVWNKFKKAGVPTRLPGSRPNAARSA